MESSNDLFIKLLNIWFYKEAPQMEEPSLGMKNFASDVITGILHGDDAIFSHEKIDKLILLLKDYGILDYQKTILQLYFEGRMRTQIELREAFNSPIVSAALQALTNVLGEVVKDFEKEAKTQIEKEKNISAIPELSQKYIFQN
jgi:hypothetical protein